MQIFHDLRKQNLPDPYLILSIEIPLLLGRREAASDLIHELLKSKFLSRQWRWYKYVVEYHAGEISEEELIHRAGPFSNARSMAHYAIAMESLGLGDRGKAKKHLEETTANCQVGWYNYHLAQAFLQRIKEDPSWPAWLPPAKAE